jgi:hypothetical protein
MQAISSLAGEIINPGWIGDKPNLKHQALLYAQIEGVGGSARTVHNPNPGIGYRVSTRTEAATAAAHVGA